jgi:hypothetical protein
VRRVEGAQAAETGDGGQLIVSRAPVSIGRDAIVTTSGDYRFFAGWRSDPFFFDTQGALNNLQFTGEDFFTNADVCSIVLEVPNSALGTGKIGIWHRTLDCSSGSWVQADRGALPSQSVFLTGDEKAAYLAAQPADDARFVPVLPTRSSTPAATHLQKQRASQKQFCRTFSSMTQGSRRPTQATVGRSPTTSLMCFFLSSPTER